MTARSVQRGRRDYRAALARGREVLRQEGLRGLWFKILGETVYRRLLLVERPLHEPVPEVKARVPVQIGLLHKNETGEYREFRPETAEAEIRSRLESGQWCFVARHQGRIVSARWAAADRVWIDYLSCELTLAAGEAYPYDLFTSPDFRGRAVSPVTSAEMLRYFQRAGYRRMVGTVLPGNQASLRASAKTGYRPYGLIGYVKIGPWKWRFQRERAAPT
jgi:L-amino acid N-acyltransferase YncA